MLRPTSTRAGALSLLCYAAAGTAFALWNLLDGGDDPTSTARTTRLVASGLLLFASLAMMWFTGLQWPRPEVGVRTELDKAGPLRAVEVGTEPHA